MVRAMVRAGSARSTAVMKRSEMELVEARDGTYVTEQSGVDAEQSAAVTCLCNKKVAASQVKLAATWRARHDLNVRPSESESPKHETRKSPKHLEKCLF